MSKALNEESAGLLRELITKITGLNPECQEFTKIQAETFDKVRKSDTMYFLSPKDIGTEIEAMSRKFVLNGFRRHAKHLEKLFKRVVHENIPKNELNTRLNAIKLLLSLSDRPTEAFWKNPEKFESIINNAPVTEEVEDWVAYLKEGIDEWSPPVEVSDQSDSENDEDVTEISVDLTRNESRLVIKENPEPEFKSFRELREELSNSCQNKWFNGESIIMEPTSDWYEANVGILWEKHITEQVKGLINLDQVTVISEYKVMREIMWQLFDTHNSTVFEIIDDRVTVKPNVTIASLRYICFENYMKQFVTYIELINGFRKFSSKVLTDEKAPNTYKSYATSVHSILYEIGLKLCEIEDEIKLQESSMTLLKLDLKLDGVLQPLFKLRDIQSVVINCDYRNEVNLISSLNLLTKLRKKFDYCQDKLEQNLVLSLYLDTLYYYCNIMEGWLVNGYLFDITNEFPIENKNHFGRDEIDLQSESPPEHWTMNYEVRKEVGEFLQDGGFLQQNGGLPQQYGDFIALICDRVLEIGRNVHFLRWVKKYDSITKSAETIHEEFSRKLELELKNFFKIEDSLDINVQENPEEMGDEILEDFQDDGFLVLGFKNISKKRLVQTPKIASTFERLTSLDAHLYPWQKMPEIVFNSILKERFSISGLLVKNVLIERYRLDKTLDFLRLIFLFENDTISPFYRKLFHKIESAKKFWGSSVPLTFNFHDVLMDSHPDLYEFASISTKSDWYQSTNALEACAKVDLNYSIQWPLSIVVTKEQLEKYRELFRFILRIKWALYTMNHLNLEVLESDRRLVALRFNILSLVSELQHFVFRNVFNVFEAKFHLDFEKANNLKSTVNAHGDFIDSMHREVGKIKDGNGYKKILECVQILKLAWDRPGTKSGKVLNQCYERYKDAFDILNPIIHPTFIV